MTLEQFPRPAPDELDVAVDEYREQLGAVEQLEQQERELTDKLVETTEQLVDARRALHDTRRRLVALVDGRGGE